MSKVSSPIEVCNLALQAIGQDPISSFTSPETASAATLKLQYDTTRRALLRSFVWNFAKDQAVLTATADPAHQPKFKYSAAFFLPNNFIRVLTLSGDSDSLPLTSKSYDIYGTKLFTKSSVSSTELNLDYIYDTEAVGMFDALFLKLLTLQLALDISYRFSLDNTLLARLEAQVRALEVRAAAIDGQERPPVRITRSRLLASRRGGRSSYDNGPYEVID